MERRSFIKVMGITAVGTLVGLDLFAQKSPSAKMIQLSPPTIHGRHGLFNLNVAPLQRNIQVQRDIFTGTGLDKVEIDRMTTVKITHGKRSAFGLVSPEFKTESPELRAVQLRADKSHTIQVGPGDMIFMESATVSINGNNMEVNEAFKSTTKTTCRLVSETDQHVFIYNTFD